MPLVAKKGAPAPNQLGLFWQMLALDGTAVDVYIYASALQSFDADPVGPVGLLKRHRGLLEAVASEKYDRVGATDGNALQITVDDLLSASPDKDLIDDGQEI